MKELCGTLYIWAKKPGDEEARRPVVSLAEHPQLAASVSVVAVTRQIRRREPRVKLVDRTPPNGVGRALRDGYAAAQGRYILTMDSDFVQIVPEFCDLLT